MLLSDNYFPKHSAQIVPLLVELVEGHGQFSSRESARNCFFQQLDAKFLRICAVFFREPGYTRSIHHAKQFIPRKKRHYEEEKT